VKLRNGVDYQVQASGTLSINTSNGRMADADFGQELPDFSWHDVNKDGFNWGIGLGDGAAGAIANVVWGPFALDHVYTITRTGAGRKLAARFLDDQYNDNSGSLQLQVYGPQQFSADLKVSDKNNAANSTTVTDGTTGNLSIAQDGSGQGVLKVGPSDSLATDYATAGGTWDFSAKAFFVWNVTPLGAGTVSKTGDDLNGGLQVTMTNGGGTGGGDFEVKSGYDLNGNGTLDTGEAQRTIDVHLV
jgi:hypothetical protein